MQGEIHNHLGRLQDKFGTALYKGCSRMPSGSKMGSRYQSTDLGKYFFFHHHFTFVVKFSFVPESPVGQVHLTGSRACHQLLSGTFYVSPSLVSSGFRCFSFRMCHLLILIFLNFSGLPTVGQSFLPDCLPLLYWRCK